MAFMIPPPSSLLLPLHIPQKLLLGPGPSNCSENILKASSFQMLGHLDEDFLNIMEEVKNGIKYAFQTNNPMTFAVSGTGHCAMEAALCNILEQRDVLLVASSSIWGDRAVEIGRRIGADCYQLSIESGDILSVNELEKALNNFLPKAAFFCHGDSSTGVLQPLDGFAGVLKKNNCLMIVDCVASLGAAPVFMDQLGIDVLYSGSQKILNAPPGLSPISFSNNAVETIKKRKTKVTSFYMDALLLGNYWKCDTEPTVYHHTAPISLMYALREALSILAAEKLENCCRRHQICAELLYKKLEQMNLTLYVPNKSHRLPSVTTVKIPPHVDGQSVIIYLKKRCNIDIAGGLGSTKGKVWRIGLMGQNCSAKNVELLSESLQKAIKSSELKSSL
ncbi:alanine--glyoxylate aminotransferase-like [Uloborus diversus]|uniref:alanine--glyoxylate aminotransferase-like n=1 Tax=Uloborus diversus TaxID=327109 RepID=UPI00240A1416|nr:alanine--glyoxylate aminotransferase-like [Uloborus diversus]